MKKIKTAVVGVGYLGRFHAQKHSALEQADLVAELAVSNHPTKDFKLLLFRQAGLKQDVARFAMCLLFLCHGLNMGF